jgi:hypothetical protein
MSTKITSDLLKALENLSAEVSAHLDYEDDEDMEAANEVAISAIANARLSAPDTELADAIEKQIAWLKHARAECAGAVRGSTLTGFDESIKRLTAVLTKASGQEPKGAEDKDAKWAKTVMRELAKEQAAKARGEC